MTKEQYEKLAAPFQKRQAALTGLIVIDRAIVAVVFFSYVLALIYLALRQRWPQLGRSLAVPFVSFCAVSVFRRLYSAKRPYETWDIKPLLPKETKGKSFPSRHVFSSFLIGMTLWQIAKPIGSLILFLGAVLACVRVVGGVHFPKDVVAAAALGMAIGFFYAAF